MQLLRRIVSLLLSARLMLEEQVYASTEEERTDLLRQVDPLRQAQDIERAARLREYVQRVLRRFPYWFAGQCRFIELSIALRDLPAAYASAQGAMALARGERERRIATVLLARCCLRGGDAGRAATLLAPLLERRSVDWPLHEEYAAALLAVGERERAMQVLGGIPREALSREGAAALSWAGDRREGEGQSFVVHPRSES